MTDRHVEQERRAADLYGLRSSEARFCPRAAAGKRCLAYRQPSCACQKHRRLLDHGRVWLDQQGRHVVTGEPYDVAAEDLADLTRDMSALGLNVTVRPQAESFWCPGHTHLILISRDGLPARHRADPAGVTWDTIGHTITSRWGGRLASTRGGRRGRRDYVIPSPTGGHLTVEVTLRPRWCTLSVDRWKTTDRRKDESAAWFEEHVWPLVQEAVKKRRGGGVAPSGGGAFATAHPIERAALPSLLTAWVDAELTWGLPHEPSAGVRE